MSPSYPRKMHTKKAAEPAWWAIRYGSYLDEDTDDSDFPGDQESDGSGSSSDSELATSGCYDRTTSLMQTRRTASFLFSSNPYTVAHVRYDLTTSWWHLLYDMI